MTTFNDRLKARRLAFSMVELMVTLSLLSIVILALFSTFSVFTKSVAGLGNYSAMSVDSRTGLELLSRDVHAAESVSLATSDAFTLTLPLDAGGDTVTYRHVPLLNTFERTVVDTSGNSTLTVLFDDVDQLSIDYFNQLGTNINSSASILSQLKSIQISAKLVKTVVTTDTTDFVISARFLMRNK